jgi:hypothetical protein
LFFEPFFAVHKADFKLNLIDGETLSKLSLWFSSFQARFLVSDATSRLKDLCSFFSISSKLIKLFTSKESEWKVIVVVIYFSIASFVDFVSAETCVNLSQILKKCEYYHCSREEIISFCLISFSRLISMLSCLTQQRLQMRNPSERCNYSSEWLM